MGVININMNENINNETKMILKFDVVKQCLIRRDKNKPVANSINYLYAEFKFSSEYDNLIKKATFQSDENKESIDVEIDDNNMCIVPPDTIKSPTLWVGVTGYNKENAEKIEITTNKEAIGIEDNLSSGSAEQSIKSVESNTLDIEKIIDKLKIEIPNIYGVKFTYNNQTGKLGLVGRDNIVLNEIDLPTERVVEKVEFNADNSDLIFTFVGGGESKVNLGDVGKAIIDVDQLPSTPFEYVEPQEIKKELIYRTPNSRLYEYGKLDNRTPLANNGTIENVYFNINLTPDEVNKILNENLDINDMPSIGETYVYYAFMTGENPNEGLIDGQLMFILENNEWTIRLYGSETFSKEIFNDNEWKIDSPEVAINAQAYSIVQGMNVGNYNDKLIDIMSGTSFESKEQFIEILTKDNFVKTDSEIVEGTTLVSSEYVTVDKIYFNINSSVDEVKTILSQIVVVDEAEGIGMYPIYFSDNLQLAYINLNPVIPGYGSAITNIADETFYFIEGLIAEEMGGVEGWAPAISTGFLENRMTGISDIDGISVGVQNELLKSLISPTPFELKGKNVTLVDNDVPLYPKTRASNVEGFAERVKAAETQMIGEYGIEVKKETFDSTTYNSLCSAKIIWCDTPETFDQTIFNEIREAIGIGLEVHLRSRTGEGMKEVRGSIVSVNGTTDWNYFDLATKFTMQFTINGKTTYYEWSYDGTVKVHKTTAIIDVETLPITKDIPASMVLYHPTHGQNICYDADGTKIELTVYTVDTLPETATEFGYNYEAYYDISQDNVFCYYASTWVPANTLLQSMGFTYGGVINDVSEATEEKYYLLRTPLIPAEEFNTNVFYRKDEILYQANTTDKVFEPINDDKTLYITVSFDQLESNSNGNLTQEQIQMLLKDNVESVVLVSSLKSYNAFTQIAYKKHVIIHLDNISIYQFAQGVGENYIIRGALFTCTINHETNQGTWSGVENYVYTQTGFEMSEVMLTYYGITEDGVHVPIASYPIHTSGNDISEDSTELITAGAVKKYVDENLVPTVNLVLRDTVSEDTTQELKEIEINGDKWKIGGGSNTDIEITDIPSDIDEIQMSISKLKYNSIYAATLYFESIAVSVTLIVKYIQGAENNNVVNLIPYLNGTYALYYISLSMIDDGNNTFISITVRDSSLNDVTSTFKSLLTKIIIREV